MLDRIKSNIGSAVHSFLGVFSVDDYCDELLNLNYFTAMEFPENFGSSIFSFIRASW